MSTASSQPTIASGPLSADMSAGIVMNGPMPIMFVMFSAVACTKPNRRSRCGCCSVPYVGGLFMEFGGLTPFSRRTQTQTGELGTKPSAPIYRISTDLSLDGRPRGCFRPSPMRGFRQTVRVQVLSSFAACESGGGEIRRGGFLSEHSHRSRFLFARLLGAFLASVELAAAAPAADRAEDRNRMVEDQIRARGVTNPRVLEVMRRVPRHRFVDGNLQDQAYEDHPLPIGHGQTISQPYIVALMTELLELKPGQKVLELGTGSGYQAAVLVGLTTNVYTIEIVQPLYEKALRRLKETGLPEDRVRRADGYLGWEEHAPFDAIVVTAAADHIPPPLLKQLRPGGRMVIPIG